MRQMFGLHDLKKAGERSWYADWLDAKLMVSFVILPQRTRGDGGFAERALRQLYLLMFSAVKVEWKKSGKKILVYNVE